MVFARLDLAQPFVDRERCLRGSLCPVVQSEVRALQGFRCRCIFLSSCFSVAHFCKNIDISRNVLSIFLHFYNSFTNPSCRALILRKIFPQSKGPQLNTKLICFARRYAARVYRLVLIASRSLFSHHRLSVFAP